MQLNPEQKLAVEHLDGPCIVTSVPGSGKTATLTSRVIHLIQDKQVPATNICCLTFTNKAANEMRERVVNRIGETGNAVWISTFHSLCVAVLRRFGSLVGIGSDFTIYDESDQKDLVNKVIRMLDLESSKPFEYEVLRCLNEFRESIYPISDYDYRSITVQVINEYLKMLGEFNALDFCGLQWKTHELFVKRPDVSTALGKRFRYIMVDEAQDTNAIQYDIVKRLASHKNLFVVGDVQQSIFGFRGSCPENIEQIKKDFSGTREIVLPRNYRSTAKILKVAESLIRHNEDAVNVTLIAERGDGHEVSLRSYAEPTSEAQSIANQIRSLRRQGYQWKDFAILYRTNAQSRIPEAQFKHAAIPYRVVGGFSFFDRKEIKSALAYLMFYTNPTDTISFTKAIGFPSRGVGDSCIGKLELLCHQEKISVTEACLRHEQIQGLNKIAHEGLTNFIQIFEKYRKEPKSLLETASGLFQETGFYAFLKEQSEKDPDFRKRIANVDELLVDIDSFAKQNPQATLGNYLQSVQLLSSADESEEEDKVTLLTMHSAKGLEFPVVFIIGVEDGLIPHYNCTDWAEERRLLYVGMTRAKDYLQLSYCANRQEFRNQKSRSYRKTPSPFLHDVSSELGVSLQSACEIEI